MTLGFDRDEYRRLVEVFPPAKISDGVLAGATEKRIEELLTSPAPSETERSYVDLLSDLLADWEDAQVDIPDIHGAELVKILLKERGLRQRDLVGIFSTESVASDVLAGRRELSRDHIAGLAAYFHVSPAAFFPNQLHQSATTLPAEPPLEPARKTRPGERAMTRR
ncbi:MAG: helix-turn-helix domain-containing protein [Chloroflexota bacterium]